MSSVTVLRSGVFTFGGASIFGRGVAFPLDFSGLFGGSACSFTGGESCGSLGSGFTGFAPFSGLPVFVGFSCVAGFSGVPGATSGLLEAAGFGGLLPSLILSGAGVGGCAMTSGFCCGGTSAAGCRLTFDLGAQFGDCIRIAGIFPAAIQLGLLHFCRKLARCGRGLGIERWCHHLIGVALHL